MRLELTMPTEPDHEHLAMLFNYVIAAQLRSSLNYSGIPESEVWKIVDPLVFDIAMLFDDGVIQVNGKNYKMRLAFVDEKGNLLPDAAEFSHLHEYAVVEEDELEGDDNFSISL